MSLRSPWVWPMKLRSLGVWSMSLRSPVFFGRCCPVSFCQTAPGTFFQNSFRCLFSKQLPVHWFSKESPGLIECSDNTIELLDLNNLQGLWYKENGGQKILKKSEIVAALNEKDFSHFYEKADLIRYREKGDYVFIRAIIEFSNYCSRRCAYCGINASFN